MGDIDHRDLEQWIGARQVCDDPLDPFAATALAALLEQAPAHRSILPLTWHWAYGITPPEAGMTGADGHPVRGGFLPPVALPRRMWAGSDIKVLEALQLGRAARRSSTVTAIRPKQGRSGPLVFVTVDHVWMQDDVECLREEQTIVYRDAPLTIDDDTLFEPPTMEAARVASVIGERTPDAVMLFRYSALTYNAHRIHYDLPYAQAEEGYPALVVHGPLIATLLLDAAMPLVGSRSITRFRFRAERPAYVDCPILLHAKPEDGRLVIWSTDSHGRTGVRATVDFAVSQ